MKIHLESTDEFVTLDGCATRAWVGKTSSGIEVTAFITRIRVKNEGDLSEFDRELLECPQPVMETHGRLERMEH